MIKHQNEEAYRVGLEIAAKNLGYCCVTCPMDADYPEEFTFYDESGVRMINDLIYDHHPEIVWC